MLKILTHYANKTSLRRARLALVTTSGKSTVPVFIQAIQATQPGRPSWVGAMNTEDGFGHIWEEMAPLELRPGGAL